MTNVEAYELARRKSKYGHKDWIVWKNTDGEFQAEAKSADSLTKAMESIGEDGRFSCMEASVGTGMIVNRDIAQIMLNNTQYGY